MSRDISDLKARLGLKKKSAQNQRSQDGGIIAPPGVRAPTSGAVPPPPGAAPPPPVIPDASEDPFAAMNKLAQVGAAQHAAKGPEIVVVNDGGPVEKVDQESRALGIAKVVGMLLVPLIIGIIVGQISQSAKTVNRTIDDAGVLHKVVKDFRMAVNDNVLNELLRAKERSPAKNQFVANDKELNASLGKADLLPKFDEKFKEEVVYKSYMYHLEPTLVANVLQFFSEYQDLQAALERHGKTARNDEGVMSKAKEKREAARPDEDVNRYIRDAPYRFAIILDVPTEKEKNVQFGARLVEVGQPVCEDNTFAQDGKCPTGVLGFGYRDGTLGGEGWGKKAPATPQGETVPSDKLVPIVPTSVFEEIIKGPEESAAEAAYLRRVNDLFTRAQALVDLGVFIEGKLSSKAKEGHSFTFFL